MRLSAGTLIIGIFALMFGLVGAYVARKHFERPMTPAAALAAEERPSLVPMASVDLDPNRPLTKGDIKLMRLSREEIRRRHLPAEFMVSADQIIGRTLREPVKAGEAFVPALFYPENLGPNVAERLKPGYRAVTVPIEDYAAVAGFAVPGSMVDVIFRTQGDAVAELPEATLTLLEGVQVLALGQNDITGAKRIAVNAKPEIRTVTLAVSPPQASALKVVEGRGQLSLSMRGPNDATALAQAQPMTLKGLLGMPKNQRFTTEIYRAGVRTKLTFDHNRVVEEQTAGFPLPPTGRSATASNAAPSTGVAVEETRLSATH